MKTRIMKNGTIIARRGSSQMSGFNLPSDGDLIQDADGNVYRVSMDGGFMLRSTQSIANHPEFVAPMTYVEFLEWFNSALV